MGMPKGHFSLFFLLSVLLGLSGCASWSLWPGGESGASQRVAGLIDRGDPDWTMRACGQEHDRLLQPTAELKRLFDDVGQPGQLSIFADLDVVEKDGRWLVRKTHRVQSTGRGCMDVSGAGSQWVGFSLADNWRVDVTARGMQLSTDDGEDGRQLAVIQEQMPDGAMGFRGVHDQGLELWLYPTGCLERSTGDYYHLTAVLVRDGQRLNGCGYKGAASPGP
ncbi:hypothetical protein [Halopseudomonas pertucinogena]|uniref:Lipoprotein n=1 Tax=Halopseudomonas pertucinogena TaxID=86175 RepID=A0ABQ2CNY0_9GAMM|nr:hypothetical protein [Halopseudomonas pertucinogena]GGI98755.1 hypothetical protein GCM10009083_14350 [Halopseudomonas pertucinogena]